MSCVNRSSSEFKSLAANNNVSINTLELITHKYWLETGSEENLPTDVYIQAQLGNGHYKETIPEVRKLWSKRYSHPRTYTSYAELQDAYQRAAQYFPQSAIVYYKDGKGNYILSVKQPVEVANNTADDFFSQDFSAVKTLDLGLDKNSEFTIDKVEELFNRFNNDRTSKHLADKVFKIAKDLGLRIYFDESLPFGMTGRTFQGGEIIYKKSFLERDINNDKKASLLLHEVIHAVTMYALSDNTANWKVPKNLEHFRTKINRIFNEVRYNPAIRGMYGSHNVREFVAELANPKFREALQSIDADKAKKSVWQKILSAFKSLFGIHDSSTYYQRSMNALDKALNAFDMDTYLEYTGGKQTLRQAYSNHRAEFKDMTTEELRTWLKNAINDNALTLNNKTKLNKDEADRLSLSQRFSQKELIGSNGILKAAEASLQRGSYSSVPEDSQSIVGVKREGKKAVIAEKQEVALEKWAKDRNIWIDNTTSTLEKQYGEPFAQEGEADVYLSNDGTKVIKQIRLDYYVEPQLLLDRVVLHNYLFPETSLNLTNFGRNREGDFVIVAEQPYVRGEKPTREEIDTFIKTLGFEPSENSPSEYINKQEGLYISDLHDENVIKANDIFFVIDADIRLNTANYGFGGTRTTKGITAQLNSFIDSMSREDIIRQLSQIEQEYADYDAAYEDKKQTPKGKSTFTFKDGTTVRTPFTPNDQQAHALNVMNDFIHSSNDTIMTLSGYAGTGKTSLMEIIAKKARKDGKLIMFSATTNKATAVLKSKVSKIHFDAQTLNKVFGINVEVDANSSYDARNLVNKVRKAEIPYGTTVVIDEASMINEENYGILSKVAKENGLKIIYVGDRAQLAPVNESKVSKVFRNTDGIVIELTKVERTDDNAILKEATNIRNGKPMSMESSFNDEGKGVAFINPKGEHRQAIVDVIKHYIKGLEKDPDYFRILAYTNKSVAQYNNFVRKQLGYTDNIPRVGEPIVGYANWGYDWRTKTYDFINSESYKVTKVDSQRKRSLKVGDQKVKMTVVPITLENSLGEQKTFDFMDIKGNSANRAAAELLASMKKMLWAKAKNASKAAKRDIYAQINTIDKFLFVNDNITDSQGHYLQTKTFDFGYALTIHKSQGSTFTNVLMDANDISKAHDNVTTDTDEYSGEWEVNLEDGTVAPASDDASVTHARQEDIAHVRQQLEYVAMSRATDTVTVITDNAEKEDSPLNHLKGKKKETTKEETPSLPVENPQSAAKYSWSRYPVSGKDSYEVSSRGDKRFSAFNATFKDGTKWGDTDISGKTIEWVYQNIIKRSGKGLPPAKDSILYNESLTTKTEREDYSYEKGYLPLWQLWASQYPEEMQDLAEKANGKVLTDMFASTRVSQARALSDILNNPPSQPADVSSVTQQLVDYIQNALGIKMLSDDEARQYLREHGYSDILEAHRTFSKDYPYHNDDKASEEERKEILDIIKGKKYNKAGTDAVTLDSNGHRVIYLIDHSSDSELYENLKDGEGFGIRKTYDVSNITKEDIYEIVRNISIQYGNSEERILRVLSRLGVRQGNLPGSDIVDAVRRGIRSHAMVYGRTGETRTQLGNNRSGINGREDSRDISFFLGRKARERYRNIIEETRPDLDEEQVRSTLDFLHSLEDSKENTAYIKAAIQWIANGSITLPRDHQVAMDIFTKAKNKHVDISKYPTMSQLLKSDEFKPKRKKISFTPDEEKTFSNHRTVTTNSGRTFEVYDVENTSEGQRAVCRALAANYEASPWCLSTFTATGEPTESAKRFWHNYEAIPRKIAFEDGKPVAFSSSVSSQNPEAWWDLNDRQEQYELSDNINSTNRDFTAFADFDNLWTPNDLDLAEHREQYIKSNIKAAKTVKEFKNTVTEALQGKMSFSDFFKNTIAAEFYPTYRMSEENIVKQFVKDRNAWNQNSGLNPFPSDNSIKELAKIAIEKGTEAAKNEIRNFVNKEHEEDRRKRAEERIKRDSDNIKSVLRNSNITEENFINKIKSLYAFQAGSDNFRLTAEEDAINNASSVEDYVRVLNDWGRDALLSIASSASQYGLDSVTNDTYNEYSDDYLPFFTTPDGEIYGFVTKDGRMYLDRSIITPEHPLHEYTHLWDNVVQKRNPKLWKRGVSLMQQFDNGKLWNEIANSEQYGKRWQQQGLKDEKFTNRIASEVHARLVGENGAKLLDEIAKKKGQKGIVAKLKEWILDVWKDLKATFSNWSDSDIEKLTLKDFNHMTVRDFADAVRFDEAPTSQTMQSVESAQTTINSNNNTLNNKNSSNGETIQQGELVQSTLSGNLEINWQQEGGRRDNSRSQSEQTGRGDDTNRIRRNDVDVETQVSQVSDALDQRLTDKGITATKQKVRKANSQEFHDAIAKAKEQNPNGWMVDVHETSDYDNDLCMITEDGKSGIAVTKDGDIVSIFSAVSKDHRLDKLMQMAIAAGGKKLDCYYLSINGVTTGLPILYAKFGFKVDAVTPFNATYAPEEYKEWKKNNPNRNVEGVAAMSLKVNAGNAIDSYSKDNTPDIEKAPVFDGENGHEDALRYRDGVMEGKKLPITVSLPAYQSFNNSLEDTEVNAEWKVDLLKDLDSQISNDNTAEQNQEIINKMNDILKANVEEDIKENSSKKEDKIQQNLDEYDKLNNQIDNLLDGEFQDKEDGNLKDLDIKFTASEIRHLSELIGNYISDMITRLQTEKDAAKELFPQMKFKDDTDFTQMSRQQIAEAIGINNLVNKAKYDFSPENEVIPYDDVDMMAKAKLALENWDALMLLASDTLALNEGFSVERNYDKGNFDINTSNSQVAYDDFNGYQDEDTIQEEQGDAQEYWQIESRTIDVLNSMSALVRQALHECYILDKEGNKVLDENWKLPLRVNPRKATNSILRWIQGSLNLEDMITKLQAKQGDNPWVQQLIERLSDKSGKEADFQSQFYGVFSKPFQLYSIVLSDGGKYTSIAVNSHPALSEAMNTITALYKMGEHPLFTESGKIKTDVLGSDNTVADSNDFNLHQALSNMRTIYDRIKHGEELDAEMTKEAAKWLAGSYRVLGYNATEEMVSDILDKDTVKNLTEKLGYMVKSLDNALQAQKRNADSPNAKEYRPFTFGAENNIGGTLRNFLTPITDSLEDTAVSAFYDSGKMYQSYVTPSFMTKLMNKFKLTGERFEDFIMNEYGNSEWFRDQKHYGIDRGWRNGMLNLLARDPNARQIFDFKVELNFNKHNYMRNMSPDEYTLSLITEYFSESADVDSMVPAWFRMPMQSNKPSSEFFKFYSYRDPSTYKDTITDQLYDMFLQECDRIQTVRMRNYKKSDNEFIKNFDSNGRKFNFLPFLNSYLENDANSKAQRTLLRNADNTVSSDNETLAHLLQRKLEGLEETKLNSDEMATLNVLVEKAIRNYMENMVSRQLSQWENEGIIEAARSIKNIVPHDDLLATDKKDEDKNKYVRKSLENYIWNDYLASKNILQLTVGDIAFYKDAEELQKRLSQLHAPGTRGNIAATDYNGNLVTDGKYRTVVLKDWDNFISNIIDNISEVFDRKIAAAPENQKAQMIALKESLVGKNGAYRNINVADAQGYSSPSSYRKKALIFGKWSRHSEEIYQKLLKGEYNYTDLQTAFQPLKPFVYTHLEKNLGVENAPIHTMHVPFQAKNSEYLLIMADAILKGEELKGNRLSKPNLLRAVYRVMEESERINPTMGIDTVQFESAIKSGLQGAMDIHQFADMAGGEEAAYTFMMNQIYKSQDGKRTNSYDVDTFVHEASYEDYCLQQEVPEHFKDHSQAHGSQIRMITPSDLDYYIDPNRADKDAEDNINYYEWTEPDGTKKRMRADEFRKEYENTIAAGIEDSLISLQQELHLDSNDMRERNIALSKILQREILSSPRYGVDLLQACSVDKKTGEFRIPKGDPIQAKRIEQLINSIIKNRVNKQKIAGGPIVQVTNFGTSKQLHIRFNDRQGGILKTKDEFLRDDSLVSQYKTYEKYAKERQAGIAYFEVFIPMWSNELFEKFADENGNIDMEAVENADPELTRMVSYRIPTEDKYSTAPMKAVGFMPREAGDAIMLPYELTTIDDSDFDVDKRYVMRKEIPIKRKPRKEIFNALYQRVLDSYNSQHEQKASYDVRERIKDNINMYLDNPERMKNMDAFMKYLNNLYRKVAYTTEKPTQGRAYRNNKIVDMTLAVLTNEKSADKILNPGGFEDVARTGYMIAAYRSPQAMANNLKWEDLQSMSEDELKELSYVSKDLAEVGTQIQFYKQNSSTSSMIGIFAVSKVAHAVLEGNGIFLDVNEVVGHPFTIAGMEFDGRMPIDVKYDTDGNLVGKTAGSLVSASADGVKKPVLDLMNVNTTTAGVLNTMLRLGMPFRKAALFMSQDVIGRTLRTFNILNLSNYVPLSKVISDALAEFEKENDISDESAIRSEELTEEELREGIRPTEHKATDYKVLLALEKLMELSEAMRNPTFATRFNSISSAVGPLIIDNLIMEHKMDNFRDSGSEDSTTHFYDSDGIVIDIDDIFYDHPVLKQFARTVDMAKDIFKDMPAGSEQFRGVLNTLPDYVKERVYGDKKLLSGLSDFFQSYLLVQSGFVDSKDLDYYINKFPKEFSKQNYKDKYPDNALIQAIRVNVSRKTGRPFLQLSTTGMDTQQKEEFSSAWIDLHKDNPELSKKLFIYNFFRAGIGFSPKTFMSLVPMYVKERLSNNGVSYIDTYRNMSDVVPNILIDQFIRNNWDNNKLVPWKGGKDSHYSFDYKKGTVEIRNPKDISDMGDTLYFKTKGNGQTYLWRRTSADKELLVFKKVTPLGDNGEYLEMSTDNLKNSLSHTSNTEGDNAPSSMLEDNGEAPVETDNQKEQKKVSDKVLEFVDLLAKQNPALKGESGINKFEDIKKNPKLYGKFLSNVFKQKGLNLDVKQAIEEFKKYC